MKPRITNHRSSQILQRLCLSLFGLGFFFIHSLILNVQTSLAAEPIFTQQAKLTKSTPGTNNYFGGNIATYGDCAVFGKPEQNSVYVYTRFGNTWSLTQTLTGGNGFGSSVTLNDFYMIIGAPHESSYKGAVYVFTRLGTQWHQKQKLIANDGQQDDRFGFPVALNNNTILIGATSAAVAPGSNAGAVYAFMLSGFTWVQQQKLTPFDAMPNIATPMNPAANVFFGARIAVSGTSLAITTSDIPMVSTVHGAVYLYTQNGSTWTFQQKLNSPDPNSLSMEHYGHDIAMSGNTLAVGGEVGLIWENVYVYVLSGSNWTLQQTITSPDTQSTAFGIVALEGNRLVVGCIQDWVLSAKDRGSAYVFERSGTVWNLRQKLIAADGAESDRFGGMVALSGNTIIVGAPYADIAGVSNQGAAYVYTLQSGNTLPTITAYGPYTIQEGSTVHNLPIAAIADAETAASSLLFDYDNTAFTFSFSNAVNAGGYVSASLTCACGGLSGTQLAELNVIDANKAMGVTTITLNSSDNTAPSIGRYPITSMAAGSIKVVYPQVAPSDNGTFTIAASASAGFTGTLTVNQTNGAVTIINAGPAGSHTVTVTVTDNCGAVTTRTFTLTVL